MRFNAAQQKELSDALYQMNATTGDLETHMSEVSLDAITFNNVEEFKKFYGLSNSDLLGVWNHHSQRRRKMMCQHCQFREVSIPNQFGNMARNRVNRSKGISKHLPNGLFVFGLNANKLAIDEHMTEEKSKEERRAIWTQFMETYKVGLPSIIGIVCSHCYNHSIQDGSLDISVSDFDPAMDMTGYAGHQYTYCVPYLIKKNKCIFGAGGHFCCKDVLGSPHYQHPIVSKEELAPYIEVKKGIIANKFVGYNANKEMFLCTRHAKCFQPRENVSL